MMAATLMASAMMGFTGCGTIMNGTHSNVTISSVPRANLTIDGKKYGKTPVTVDLSHKKDHQVILVADGYRPYQTTIESHFSKWYLGDFLFFAPVGLIIDPLSGGMDYLEPKNINAGLAKIGLQKNIESKLMGKSAIATGQ
jgi:hypothetical protein